VLALREDYKAPSHCAGLEARFLIIDFTAAVQSFGRSSTLLKATAAAEGYCCC
jgi:hypothetical protein